MTAAAQNLNPVHLILELLNLTTWAVAPHQASITYNLKKLVFMVLIAKFTLKLRTLGKTTRPFRYDLNQIPYDYIMHMRNRIKGLELIDRVPDELWMDVPDIGQETGSKTIPMERKCKKSNGCLRRPCKYL